MCCLPTLKHSKFGSHNCQRAPHLSGRQFQQNYLPVSEMWMSRISWPVNVFSNFSFVVGCFPTFSQCIEIRPSCRCLAFFLSIRCHWDFRKKQNCFEQTHRLQIPAAQWASTLRCGFWFFQREQRGKWFPGGHDNDNFIGGEHTAVLQNNHAFHFRWQTHTIDQ